uniref:Mucin5Blike [Macaca fascicularis] n=1 Tax=Lepeophtheirus salmonis TaxID=72036 RepID=A0A0K2TC14_LEPSM
MISSIHCCLSFVPGIFSGRYQRGDVHHRRDNCYRRHGCIHRVFEHSHHKICVHDRRLHIRSWVQPQQISCGIHVHRRSREYKIHSHDVHKIQHRNQDVHKNQHHTQSDREKHDHSYKRENRSHSWAQRISCEGSDLHSCYLHDRKQNYILHSRDLHDHIQNYILHILDLHVHR